MEWSDEKIFEQTVFSSSLYPFLNETYFVFHYFEQIFGDDERMTNNRGKYTSRVGPA